MPETAVGKDDALPGVDDEIRATRKRGSCTRKSNPACVSSPARRFSMAVSRVPMARIFLLRVALSCTSVIDGLTLTECHRLSDARGQQFCHGRERGNHHRITKLAVRLSIRNRNAEAVALRGLKSH